MLVNIVDGKPEGYLTLTEAAKKFGVRREVVYDWIRKGKLNDHEMFFIRDSSRAILTYYISDSAARPINHTGQHLKKKPLSSNHINTILIEMTKHYPLPNDADLSAFRIQRIIDDVLCEREKQVLFDYHDKTLRTIGKQIGLSAERVRQIKQRALRKLSKRIWAEQPKTQIPKDTNKDIYTLNLSVRAHNCLARSGVKTIDDLLRLTADEVSRIRMLGSKTYQEIIDKVHEHGYKFNWEE